MKPRLVVGHTIRRVITSFYLFDLINIDRLSLAGASLVTKPVIQSSIDPILLQLMFSWWAPLLAFVWGTLWGSFANVVIYRLPRGKSVVFPPSSCGSCEKRIAWYDNLPIISYLWLRGACRHCDETYSLRYLAVELIGGILSFVLYRLSVVVQLDGGAPASWESILVWQLLFLFTMSLVIVTYTDLDVWIIPDQIVLPVGMIGLCVAWLKPGWLDVPMMEAIAAAVLGYLLVASIRWIYLKWRGIEAMGLGDGKLLFMVGAFCGLKGLVWTLGAGAFQGLLISIPLLIAGRNVANSDLQEVHGDDPTLGEENEDAGVMGMRVPFGPFLALAAMEYVLLGAQIERLWMWLLS